MDHVTSPQTTGPCYVPVHRTRRDSRCVRILRWTFHRDEGESVVCELGLTGDDTEFELRVPPEWNPTGAPVERFDDALAAFQRHAMIERVLLEEGWFLHAFESERVTLH
jgi:hypothetical protein